MAVTVNYSYNLPTVGGDLDTWGNLLNANWTKVDTKLKALSDADTAISGAALTTAQVIALIYPIGSIYISIKNVNPGVFLTGTTWVAKAQGRAIVGVGSADGVAWAVNEAKGQARVALTTAEIPAHAHVVDPPAQAFNTGTASANHTHGVSQSGHSHGISDPGHNHYVNDPGHRHQLHWRAGMDEDQDASEPFEGARESGSWSAYATTGIWLNASGTGVTVGAANANISINGDGANHYHAVTVDLNAFWSQNTGSTTSHENIQPSIGLYIWERTA